MPTELLAAALKHQIYSALLWAAGRVQPLGKRPDRGAVSVEEVLWYLAAAVAVAVIAAVLWNTIRNETAKSVDVPTTLAP